MWFFRIWAFLFLAGGALIAAVAIRNLRHGSASKGWPQTQGRILRSFVLVQTDSERGKSYTPSVEYEYSVEGVTYRGTRIRYGQIGSTGRRRAERALADYAEGASVPVWFDPRNHKDAVLACGTSWGNAAILLAGLVFMGAAFALPR